MSSQYQFFTEWRVTGTLEEVKDVLSDGEGLTRWWPSVYLDVRKIEEGAENGLGRVVDVHTKGWLPYTLRWELRITEVSDDGFALEARGDLEGTGRWKFVPIPPEVIITYDWRVRATKPLLRRLSWLLRPVFAANHHWAMRKGEESLQLEIRRRRADSERARQEVPPPPAPTFRRLARVRSR